MVEESVTDGTRIAELLASELEGLTSGPLLDVSVVDADPDAEPTDAGTYAYGIAFDGERVGEVRIRHEGALLSMTDGWSDPDGSRREGLSLESGALVIERGAAVKRAVDVLRQRLD